MKFNISGKSFLKSLVFIRVGAVALAASAYYFMQLLGKKVARMFSPGQYEVEKFQVLHVGTVPRFDENIWTLEIYGLVNRPMTLSCRQVRNLPKVASISDFHYVIGWSKFENKWEGVRFRTIIEMAEVSADAKFATIESEYGHKTSLPLEDLSEDDVLPAYRLDEEKLPPEHGGPLRIVVPHKYACKSAKRVRKIKFTQDQELGYWESAGYSNTADPFKDDRYA